MQNIPGIALEQATEQLKSLSFSKVQKTEQQLLFADLFDQHATRIENELALAPVSTKDKILSVTPDTTTSSKTDTLSTSSNEKKNKVLTAANEEALKEERANAHDRNKRMTQEDLDAVKDDLKGYGFSDEEIDGIQKKVNSDDGMTWGQFVSVIAQKMSDLRKTSLSDDQKANLNSFFAKLGFSTKESDKMIKQLENGNQNDVMAAIQKKLDAMPEGKQLLITKDEIEAFSSAMNFSKEFTSQLKEMFGKNMLTKELKEAFTMIRQELANLDAKDQELVKAVGKQFLQAIGKEAKESTLAKDVKEAVDLNPRVAENKDEKSSKVRDDLKDAVEQRKDAMTSATTAKGDQKATPEKAEADANGQADDNWNHFFDKLKSGDNAESSLGKQLQAKTENAESLLKAGLSEASTKTDAKSWEKISAPKVMRQVENAFIKTLNNGTKQLTLQLTPENLGKLSVMLQVNGKEVSATIRAESPDAAKVIADNIDIIKNSLEAQGLKVDKLDVQTGLLNDSGQNNWFGSNEHNMAREREAMVAMRKHMQSMRSGNGMLAQDMQSNIKKATVADQGLHIIA